METTSRLAKGLVPMRFYYGEKMFLRVLDETEFWKLQEAEHTVVIRQAVPGLEEVYVRQLQDWQLAFSQAQASAVKFIEAVVRAGERLSPELQQEIKQFINCCINQSREFVRFLNFLSANSAAIRNNPVATTIIDHIRRESEYFIGIATVAVQKERAK